MPCYTYHKQTRQTTSINGFWQYTLQTSGCVTILNLLTLPMLRLLSPKEKARKDFQKSSKPCHVGIHWIALADWELIDEWPCARVCHSSALASFCISQISQQQQKG